MWIITIDNPNKSTCASIRKSQQTWHGHLLTLFSLTVDREVKLAHPCSALTVKITRNVFRTSTTAL